MTTLQRSSSRTLHLHERSGLRNGITGPSTTRAGLPARPALTRASQIAERPASSVAALDASAANASKSAPGAASLAASIGASDNVIAAAPLEARLASESLLRGAKVVQIVHNGEAYQLRATRHGKLILTK